MVFKLLPGLACIVLTAGALRAQAPAKYPADQWSVQVTFQGLKVVSQTPPIEYPASAKAVRAQGFVGVQVKLDAAGNVTEATLVDAARTFSPAPAELRQVALAAIRKWRFADVSPTDPTKKGPKIVIVSFLAPPPPLTAVQESFKEGDDLLRKDQFDKAIQQYEQGARKFPEEKVAFLKRECEAYLRQGNQSAVKAKLNELLKITPNDAEARGLRASIQLDEGGDVNEVIKDLADVIKARPDNFMAHFNLGRAYFSKGDLDQAAKEYTAALHLQPAFPPALAGRGQIEFKKGDYAAALQDSNQLTRLKSYDQARGLVQQVLAKDPKNAQALEQQKALNELHK